MNADASVGGKITRAVRPEGASPGGYTLGAGEVLGQYRIVRPLGRGGMGEVYEAENVVNRKRVALKVLPRAATGGTFVDRFRIESRVMMDLEHPGIVRVHHAGEEQGVYYLTMDLVTGPDGSPHSLEDLLAAQRRGEGAGDRPFAEHEVRRMALEVCEALAYAHGKGVVHRDLKPANLLVGPDGFLRVTDFGLAKVVGSDYLQTVIERSISLSLAGEADRSLGDQATQGPGARRPSSSARALLGTYDYMAPEQKSGGEVTPRADIYAFGVLLYRLLTGEKPEGAYKAPSRLGRSRRWDAIVERCLQRNPADRYASAAELRQALAAAARRPRVWKAAAFAAAGLATAAAVAILSDRTDPGALSHAPVPAAAPAVAAPAPAPVPPPATPAPAVTNVPFRIEVVPAGATVTLTHDAAGLAAEKVVPEEGVTLDLAPGTYHALVALAGYRSVQQDVEAAPGAPTWKVRLSERRGELTVRSDPGVEVFVRDARNRDLPQGRTAADGLLRIETLREGSYTLVLAKTDYASATGQVTLVEGKPQEYKRPLAPLPGRVKVGGREGLEIWEAGARLGSANVWLDLSAGDHALDLRCKGFRTERLVVAIPPNRPVVKQCPDLKAEAGSVRVLADAPANAAAFLAAAKTEVRIGDAAWRAVRALPFTEEGVPCEPLDVALRVEGFSVDAASRRVTPRDGVVADARFALTPLPAQFTVACAAPGAEVFDVNGARVCPVGAAMSLQPFTAYVLTVRAARHKPATLTVDGLQPGSQARRQVALEEQEEPNPGEEMTVDLGGGVKLTLCWCPAGNFLMGSPADEADRGSDETQHRVTLTKGFWMGKYEVTQAQWERVMGSNPSRFTRAGANAPVEQVSWDDCQEFIRKVNGLVSGGGFRLPTEVEWEYACRAGSTTAFHYGNDLDSSMANFDGNCPYGNGAKGRYRETTVTAGTFKPNAWNLYDMHGNVWEWCSDWYGEYPSGGVSDPTGPGFGSGRVGRGGCWGRIARICRSACRGRDDPGSRCNDLGLRLARSPP